MAFIQLKNIVVERKGRKILDIPYFAIEKGERVAIIGPNGAGKTTFILLMALLLKPTRGEVKIDNKPVLYGTNIFQIRRRFAVVFQEPLLFRTTVWQNLEYGLKIRGMKKYLRKKILEEWLDRFKISHLKDRKPKDLSGGEAQRVNLCRAVLLEPEVLFMDEPFLNLDPPSKNALIDDLKRIMKKDDFTLILSTHDLYETLEIAERIVVVEDGKIIQDGLKHEVLSNPSNSFLQDLIRMGKWAKGYY